MTGTDLLEDAVTKDDGLFQLYSVHCVHFSGWFLFMVPEISSVVAHKDICSGASGHCKTGQIKKADSI